MNRITNQNHDPDDLFAETKMSFGDHIEDLRSHLLRAIYGFVLAMIVAMIFGKQELAFIKQPVEEQLSEYNKRYVAQKMQEMRAAMIAHTAAIPPIPLGMRVDLDLLSQRMGIGDAQRKNLGLAPINKVPEVGHRIFVGYDIVLEQLGLGEFIDTATWDDASTVVIQAQVANPLEFFEAFEKNRQAVLPQELTALNVQEAFMAWFKVSMIVGFVLSSPWVFYQIWAFIAAGLYPHEKRLVNVYLPVSLVLFLIGAVMCQFFVVPKAVEALLWFNEYVGLRPELRFSEWLGFAIFMPVVFGLSFQTPLVMLFIYQIGIMKVDTFRSYRKIAWFAMAVFAAVITPSVDAFSMLLMWVPMCLLYELGILLCLFSPNRPLIDFGFSEPEEMVEV